MKNVKMAPKKKAASGKGESGPINQHKKMAMGHGIEGDVKVGKHKK